MDTIGPRLRATRRAQGVSQEALAERTGVAVTTIIRIEKGTAKPKLDTVWKFAEALKVDPKHLAYGDGENPDEQAMVSEKDAAFIARNAPIWERKIRAAVERMRLQEDDPSLPEDLRTTIQESRRGMEDILNDWPKR